MKPRFDHMCCALKIGEANTLARDDIGMARASRLSEGGGEEYLMAHRGASEEFELPAVGGEGARFGTIGNPGEVGEVGGKVVRNDALGEL